MDRFEQALRRLPDTVIITDIYWYILDYNREAPFERLKRGRHLSRYMPDCASLPRDRYHHSGRIFQRSVSPVYQGELHVGYVADLVDITDKVRLTELRRRKAAELEALTRKQAQANRELEDYVHQAVALVDAESQLQIARTIHDGAGHAITALNTISGMCLQLRDSDPEQCARLIDEGLAICRRARNGQIERHYDSVTEMLTAFRDASPFPIELAVTGEETAFSAGLCDVILGVCREAYHNTLSHSLADRLSIDLRMTPADVTLRIADNGRFHGPLVKGFGLQTMEQNVRASGGDVAFEAEEGCGFGVVAKWRAET